MSPSASAGAPGTPGPRGPGFRERRALLLELFRRELPELGVSAFGFLDRPSLLPFIERFPEASRRYGLEAAGLVLAAALAYGEGLGPAPPDSSAGSPLTPAEPLARIGRFARANWYAELLARLELAAKAARSALLAAGADPGPASGWRRLANSGLPERPLAVAAGLGSVGRSGLLLVPGFGPGVVLGLLLIPLSALGLGLEEGGAGRGEEDGGGRDPGLDTGRFARGADCGSCRACIEACPTGALDYEKGYERLRCIQHWSSREGALPPEVEAAWGDRLYGCDECSIACPRFSRHSALRPSLGVLGEGLSAAWVLGATEGELRARLRGTALGMAWISPAALRRNARLALAAAGKEAGSPPI